MPQTGPLDRIVNYVETADGQRVTVVGFSIVASVVLWTLPGTAFAYIFGIPLLFFVPGFAVVRLFFWKGTSPEAKFVLSLGLSILVLIFLGLLLVLTPIGLDSNTTRTSVLVFVIGAVLFDINWSPKKTTEKEAQPAPEPERAPRTIKLDKVVAAMLGTAIVISVISLALIVTAHYPSRTYFALTDDNGSADINTTRAVNSTLNLVLEAKNGEDGQRIFRIVAYNETISYLESFNRTMAKGEIWDQNISHLLVYPGNFRLDFDLYIKEQGKPEYFYGNLHLYITVEYANV